MGSKRRILAFAPAEMALRVTEDGKDYLFGLGGSGSLTVAAMAKMGVDCLHCTSIGSDFMGKVLRHIYTTLGVSERYVRVRVDTATALSIRGGGGDKLKYVFSGTQGVLMSSDVEDAFTCIPDAVYLEEAYSPKILEAVFMMAHHKNIPVFFRGNGAAHIDFKNRDFPIEAIILNEKEACQLAEMNTYSASNIAIAISIKIPAKYYIINLGQRGIYLYDGMHHRNLMDARAAQIHDQEATMASFTGAFLAEYTRTGDVEEACEYANLASALAGKGGFGMDTLPDLVQLRSYISKLVRGS